MENEESVPWESLGQVNPIDLPEADATYPGPWSYQERGSGYFDVSDVEGKMFASVHCSNGRIYNTFLEKVKKSAEWLKKNE